jgi:hypothetical protein
MSEYFESVRMTEPVEIEKQNTFSKDFLDKIKLCIKPENPDYWILDAIINQKNLLEIASKYLDESDYDGNFLTSTVDAMFEAFISFKEGKYIDSEEALYLSSRSGVLAQYVDYCTEKILIFTVRELIKEIDGPQFDLWLFENGNSEANHQYILDDYYDIV